MTPNLSNNDYTIDPTSSQRTIGQIIYSWVFKKTSLLK